MLKIRVKIIYEQGLYKLETLSLTSIIKFDKFSIPSVYQDHSLYWAGKSSMYFAIHKYGTVWLSLNPFKCKCYWK